MYFIIDHNLPLDLYGDLVELAHGLGAPNFVRCCKNATYTSWDSAQGLLIQLSGDADKIVQCEINVDHLIMLDEVTDVTSRKHLAILCRYTLDQTVIQKLSSSVTKRFLMESLTKMSD